MARTRLQGKVPWCVVTETHDSCYTRCVQVLYRHADHQLVTVVTPRSTALDGPSSPTMETHCPFCQRPFDDGPFSSQARDAPESSSNASQEHTQRPYVAPGYFLCLEGAQVCIVLMPNNVHGVDES